MAESNAGFNCNHQRLEYTILTTEIRMYLQCAARWLTYSRLLSKADHNLF